MGILSQLQEQLVFLQQLRKLTQQLQQMPAQLAPPVQLQDTRRPRMSL